MSFKKMLMKKEGYFEVAVGSQDEYWIKAVDIF